MPVQDKRPRVRGRLFRRDRERFDHNRVHVQAVCVRIGHRNLHARHAGIVGYRSGVQAQARRSPITRST